jgi:hypothetical protein
LYDFFLTSVRVPGRSDIVVFRVTERLTFCVRRNVKNRERKRKGHKANANVFVLKVRWCDGVVMAMDFGACLAFGFLGCTKCLPGSALYAIPVVF